MTAAIRRINPLAASSLKNHLKGFDKFFYHINYIKSLKNRIISLNTSKKIIKN